MKIRDLSKPDDRPLVLIPAAGFGTRVGSPAAKEILPLREGEPLILKPLRLCAERGWPALIITRPEKRELKDFLSRLDLPRLELQLCEIPPTRDWPETLLHSQTHWRKRNLVILPDTEFSPSSALESLAEALNEPSIDVAWAEHPQPNLSTWGTIERLGSKRLRLCEKPSHPSGGKAWGLLAFKPESGKMLLAAQLRSSLTHQWQELPLRGMPVPLTSFEDLTRPSAPGPAQAR